MSTLLMRLAGPMQSWGVQSRFEIRDTIMEPSKSGVIGLVCAALGRQREEPINDLASLRMGVRVDREGAMRHDYHTAQDIAIASGGRLKDCQPSRRYYLADASFVVGLQGERELLEQIDAALRDPVWPLALGRKSFAPGRPIAFAPGRGVVEQDLFEALHDVPREVRRRESIPSVLRYVIDHGIVPETGECTFVSQPTRPDQPISFEPRRFTLRQVDIFYTTYNQEEEQP